MNVFLYYHDSQRLTERAEIASGPVNRREFTFFLFTNTRTRASVQIVKGSQQAQQRCQMTPNARWLIAPAALPSGDLAPAALPMRWVIAPA